MPLYTNVLPGMREELKENIAKNRPFLENDMVKACAISSFAFGIGVHRCAGSNLARMEMDVALRTWFKRITEFTLSDPEGVTWAPGQVRGARNVPIKF